MADIDLPALVGLEAIDACLLYVGKKLAEFPVRCAEGGGSEGGLVVLQGIASMIGGAGEITMDELRNLFSIHPVFRGGRKVCGR